MQTILEKLVPDAFRRACEHLSNDERELKVIQNDGSLKILLLLKNSEVEELLEVKWPEITILREKLKTVHVLVKALGLLQLNISGTVTNFGTVLVVEDGVIQCFPLLRLIKIDFETKKAEYTGYFETSKRMFEKISELNEFFRNAAANQGHRSVNVLYRHILHDVSSLEKTLKKAELEEILKTATTLARKKLWFVTFRQCILVRVATQDFIRSDTSHYLITPNGMSKPKISKKYASSDFVRLLWKLKRGEIKPKYSWSNPRSMELLKDMLEKARKTDVIGRDKIINALVQQIPPEARKKLVGVLI